MVGRARSEEFFPYLAARVAQWWSHVKGDPPSIHLGGGFEPR